MNSIDGKLVSSYGYKVVTKDMKSLGLRNNPNILTYPIREWYMNPTATTQTHSDDGGIWVAKGKGGANTLRKYMLNKHKQATRVFKAALLDELYQNSYRVKTSGIYLLEEIIL